MPGSLPRAFVWLFLPAGHSYPRQSCLSLLISHFKGHILREALPGSSVPKSHSRTLSHVCSKAAPWALSSRPPPWLSPSHLSPHLASPGCGLSVIQVLGIYLWMGPQGRQGVTSEAWLPAPLNLSPGCYHAEKASLSFSLSLPLVIYQMPFPCPNLGT